jgi:hypothetical protein
MLFYSLVYNISETSTLKYGMSSFAKLPRHKAQARAGDVEDVKRRVAEAAAAACISIRLEDAVARRIADSTEPVAHKIVASHLRIGDHGDRVTLCADWVRSHRDGEIVNIEVQRWDAQIPVKRIKHITWTPRPWFKILLQESKTVEEELFDRKPPTAAETEIFLAKLSPQLERDD